MCNMILNKELNGIELYFESKPQKEILENLKANKFRWSNYKKCWYAKQNNNTLKLAETMAENENNITTETTIETTGTKIKAKKVNLSLWDQLQFEEGTTDTKEYNWKFVGSNYTGLSVKETAKVIRQHLKTRFPEVKFSVTSSHNKIDITIKESPYNYLQLKYSPEIEQREYREYDQENNKELNAIINYCQKLLNSYNWDDSDSMSDYFNCHYYDSVYVYEYIQTEQTEEIKNDITNYRNKLEELRIAGEEQKEKDFQEYLTKQEEDKKAHQEREKEEAEQTKTINNSIDIIPLEEDKQYFIINSQFAHINKNCTLDQYREEVKKGEYYLQNVKITKEIHFQTEKALNYFSNMLLYDFEFLKQTGGSYTDDIRISSMTDYNNMTKEERKTVIFNLYGVAVYFDNKLRFVIDCQGFSYARYVGLVDNVKIEKNDPIKQLINHEQIKELKIKVDMLEDYSTKIITENNLINSWNSDNWTQYKILMKDKLKENNFKPTKEIIQQIPEEMEALKVAMYKLLKEVDGIQEQFSNANLQQGNKVTLFYMSDFGGIVTSRIIFDSVENTKYAQYENAVKLTFKPENKRKLYYNYFHSTILVYNGWLNLPEDVLHTIEHKENMTITKGKFSSCDNRQYDEILSHFEAKGIKPIINTYKPTF